MKRRNVYACLLAGGKGTRLWPLSLEGHSKAFVAIGEKKPLFVETIERLRGLIPKKNVLIVVDKTQAGLVKKFAKDVPGRNILVEPFGRSTASAVGLAAIELRPEDIMVVLPTDALISEAGKFKKAIKSAVSFLGRKDGALLCIGMVPTEASSAYGYVKLKSRAGRSVYSIDNFMEKPKEKVAARLVKRKNYLWNAGIFVFKAKDILGAMKKHAPLLYTQLLRIKMKKSSKKAAYSRMKNVSIDYQVMEKAKNLYCVKANFSWRDLGSWNSLEKLIPKDKNGNIRFGKAALLDTRNSIIYNSTKEKLGVAGITDTIVVRTKNGTLVCGKKDAEKVKKLVAGL